MKRHKQKKQVSHWRGRTWTCSDPGSSSDGPHPQSSLLYLPTIPFHQSATWTYHRSSQTEHPWWSIGSEHFWTVCPEGGATRAATASLQGGAAASRLVGSSVTDGPGHLTPENTWSGSSQTGTGFRALRLVWQVQQSWKYIMINIRWLCKHKWKVWLQ